MLQIEIKHLTKKYKKKTILDDVTLTFDNSLPNFIIGPNGSGKTTLLKAMLQFIKYEGKISEISHLSYVPEKIYLPLNIKAIDFLTLALKIKTKQAIDLNKLLISFNLEKEKDKYIKDLSFGTKQKLVLLIGLLDEKDVYIFDEPLNGLDAFSILAFASEILNLVKKEKLIIIVSHEMTPFLNLKRKEYIIQNGHISLYEASPKIHSF